MYIEQNYDKTNRIDVQRINSMEQKMNRIEKKKHFIAKTRRSLLFRDR